MSNIIDALAKIGKITDTKTGEEKELLDFRFRYIGLYFTAVWCSFCIKIADKLPQAI